MESFLRWISQSYIAISLQIAELSKDVAGLDEKNSRLLDVMERMESNIDDELLSYERITSEPIKELTLSGRIGKPEYVRVSKPIYYESEED